MATKEQQKQPGRQPAQRATNGKGTPAAARPGTQKGQAVQAAPERLEPPRSLSLAVRLMYAGAALTVIGTAADVIVIAVGGTKALRTGHQHATAAQLHASLGVLITSVLFSGVIEAVLWLFMARANRAGLTWARIAASVLLGINTILLVTTVLHGGAVTLALFSGLTWLVGVGAIWYLWQRDSSVYFAAPAAPAARAAPGSPGGPRRPSPEGRSRQAQAAVEVRLSLRLILGRGELGGQPPPGKVRA